MGGWQIAATLCGFVSLPLYLTVLVSDHWLESIDIDANAGLWKSCVHSSVDTVCHNSGMDVKGFVHATRAFMILGLFPAFISSILLFVLFFRSEIGSWPIIGIVFISSHVAAGFVWIALSIYTGSFMSDKDVYFGWSVIAGWSCPVLLHLTGEFARRSCLQNLRYEQI